MTTGGLFPQPLKPHLFRGIYVVAKATTHKHSRVGTQTLHPREGEGLSVNTQRKSGTRTLSMWTGQARGPINRMITAPNAFQSVALTWVFAPC
jgi:hypothetical protein